MPAVSGSSGPGEDWTDVAFRPDVYQQPVQRKAADAGAEGAAAGSAGSGQKLPEPVQAQMEGAFGADFSNVRVHEGPQAAEMGALAYTQGTDIHFQPGQYDPGSQQGQELLGHELTHVVQQSTGQVSGTTQANGVAVNDDPSLEHEADDKGARAARGESVGDHGGGAVQAKAIQRQEEAGASSGPDALSEAAAFGSEAVSAASAARAEGVSDAELLAFLREIDALKTAAVPGSAPAGGQGAAAAEGGAAAQRKVAPGHRDDARAPEAPVQRRASAGAGSAGVVQMDQPARGDGFSISIPGAYTVSGWKARLLTSAISAVPGVGLLFSSAITATNAANITIGFGPSAGGGLGVGGSLSAGVLVAPGGVLGVYGGLSAACGAIASLSATAQVTIVGGGVDRFGGAAIAFTAAGGEGVVGALSILCTTNMEFLGISGEIGVGVGAPVEVYVQYSRTWTAGGQ